MKCKIHPVQFFKKLRSRIPRRRRWQISPILRTSLCSIFSDAKTCSVDFSVDSSAYSQLTRDVSCNSSRVSVGPDDLKISKPRASPKKIGFQEISESESKEEVRCENSRRITRSYSRQRESEKEEKRGFGNDEVELLESSCVESCSGRKSVDRSSKLRRRTANGADNAKRIRGIEDSEAITRSGFSGVQTVLDEFSWKILNSGGENVKGTDNSIGIKENEVAPVTSGLESSSEVKFGSICSYIGKLSDKTIEDGENRVSGTEVSPKNADTNFTISNSESTIEQKPKFIAADSDLACSEHLSYGDISDYSSLFSELQSEILLEGSDLDFSDYTPSIWFDSGSQFSEGSVGDKPPSPTFSLFLHYSQQFCRSTSPLNSKVPSSVEDDYSDGSTLLRFEDEEDEESYQMFRNRERRQVYLRDYAEEYCSATEYGKLIIQQRLQMVHWIVEQSATKDLHRETMFLGVNLLDRFLCKGFFKNKRSLQIVGIACLTLATRIEENQPLNSVRQKTFAVGTIVYSRCEVVAMEWLVQEVLNFQCFLPTVYNFLWFYLKAARANEAVDKTAKYLAVLALLGHEQLCYWPSTVAAGLVILASLAANQDSCCHRIIETHARTKDDDLPGCIKSLEWLVKYIY
ncbi:cyclin-SDS [Cornus florida]|uniref:cyclin-SDS n=1 Tax=Cornus florida TaxID=4283 RepID=UPI00289C1454|nr:cyclin-SDS [Cornus florida]